MTERTQEAERNQGATKRDSAAAAAGATPATAPQRIQDADAVPLSEDAVRNGGAFMGGASPADAEDDPAEPRQPLDSRQAFGGDGAQYVDPALGSDHRLDSAGQARFNGTTPGEDGYDSKADAPPHQTA